jgi:broad specificity phosphatase PhoE
MKIFLARHGNTFSPGERVVRIGARTDIPLSPSGIEQGKNLALSLSKIALHAVYAGNLRRQTEFARLVVEQQHTKPHISHDERLNELDFGDWEGLTNEEIVAKFGKESLECWNEEAVWPESANWGGSQEKILDECRDFLNEVIETQPDDANILIVSSSGRLRSLLRAANSAIFEQLKRDKQLKINTGTVSLLEYTDGAFALRIWNGVP